VCPPLPMLRTAAGGSACAVVVAALAFFWRHTPDGNAESMPKMSEQPLPKQGSLPATKLAGDKSVLERLGLERVLLLVLMRAINRSQELLQDASSMQLPLERLWATDGASDLHFRSKVMPLSMPNSTCADLIGAIFDTHENAWKQAAAGTKPTLVLEDDVRLPPNFLELFEARMRELPEGFDMAFAGSSTGPDAPMVSQLISRPQSPAPERQAILGFWAYVISPKGAKKLLEEVKEHRKGKRRRFQPVDLFVSRRVGLLEVFMFEPSPELNEYFEEYPDRHHVLTTMRQKGIVTIQKTESLNAPANNSETAELNDLSKRVVWLAQEGERFVAAWRLAKRLLQRIRRYSCWNVAQVLQNTGLTLLRLLSNEIDGAPGLGGASNTLRAALEAFGSSKRYTEGTWMDGVKGEEYPQWIQHALMMRQKHGFPAVEPPEGWNARVTIQNFGWLDIDIKKMFVQELRQARPKS